jgi:hypothetical protein
MAMGAKRLAALVGSLILLATAAFGQQITRVAVVDLSKVISAYSREAQAVKDFEAKKSQVQTDIDRMSAEIMRLMSLKADSEKAGDKAGALRYRDDIDRKTKVLTRRAPCATATTSNGRPRSSPTSSAPSRPSSTSRPRSSRRPTPSRRTSTSRSRTTPKPTATRSSLT